MVNVKKLTIIVVGIFLLTLILSCSVSNTSEAKEGGNEETEQTDLVVRDFQEDEAEPQDNDAESSESADQGKENDEEKGGEDDNDTSSLIGGSSEPEQGDSQGPFGSEGLSFFEEGQSIMESIQSDTTFSLDSVVLTIDELVTHAYNVVVQIAIVLAPLLLVGALIAAFVARRRVLPFILILIGGLFLILNAPAIIVWITSFTTGIFS